MIHSFGNILHSAALTKSYYVPSPLPGLTAGWARPRLSRGQPHSLGLGSNEMGAGGKPFKAPGEGKCWEELDRTWQCGRGMDGANRWEGLDRPAQMLPWT